MKIIWMTAMISLLQRIGVSTYVQNAEDLQQEIQTPTVLKTGLWMHPDPFFS